MRILSIYLQNSEKKTKPVLGTYFIGNHKTNSISNNQPKKTSPKKNLNQIKNGYLGVSLGEKHIFLSFKKHIRLIDRCEVKVFINKSFNLSDIFVFLSYSSTIEYTKVAIEHHESPCHRTNFERVQHLSIF